jgi:hypothetical protein
MTATVARLLREPAPTPPLASSPALQITLKLNGQPYTAWVEPRVTRLDLLRERAQLLGPKKGL